VPFVWQLYPQHDGAHGPKAEAFASHWREDAAPQAPLPAAVEALIRAWNGLAPADLDTFHAALQTLQRSPVAPGAAWPAAARAFAQHQAGYPDLATRLLQFVSRRALAARGSTV
jgi:hypothetical protein